MMKEQFNERVSSMNLEYINYTIKGNDEEGYAIEVDNMKTEEGYEMHGLELEDAYRHAYDFISEFVSDNETFDNRNNESAQYYDEVDERYYSYARTCNCEDYPCCGH